MLGPFTILSFPLFTCCALDKISRMDKGMPPLLLSEFFNRKGVLGNGMLIVIADSSSVSDPQRKYGIRFREKTLSIALLVS